MQDFQIKKCCGCVVDSEAQRCIDLIDRFKFLFDFFGGFWNQQMKKRYRKRRMAR